MHQDNRVHGHVLMLLFWICLLKDFEKEYNENNKKSWKMCASLSCWIFTWSFKNDKKWLNKEILSTIYYCCWVETRSHTVVHAGLELLMLSTLALNFEQHSCLCLHVLGLQTFTTTFNKEALTLTLRQMCLYFSVNTRSSLFKCLRKLCYFRI